MLSRDGISGLICVAISLWLLVLTLWLPPATMVPIGPAFYPRIVLSFMAFLSALLLALDVIGMRRRQVATAIPTTSTAAAPVLSPNYRLVFLTFIEFGIYQKKICKEYNARFVFRSDLVTIFIMQKSL